MALAVQTTYPMSIRNTRGEWLNQRMKEAGHTQTSFADALNTSQGLVSSWIRDKKTPSPENCDKIAQELGLDIDEVLTRFGHRPELATDVDQTVREIIASVRLLPEEDQGVVLDFARWRVNQAKRRR